MATLRNKVVACVMALMVVASFGVLAGCGGGGAAGGNLKDGTYTGVSDKGHGGNVEVKVTVAQGKISAIEVGDNAETPNLLEKAEAGVIPAIIEKQNTKVDGVSGSTMSSDAIKDGVNKALEQAK